MSAHLPGLALTSWPSLSVSAVELPGGALTWGVSVCLLGASGVDSAVLQGHHNSKQSSGAGQHPWWNEATGHRFEPRQTAWEHGISPALRSWEAHLGSAPNPQAGTQWW